MAYTNNEYRITVRGTLGTGEIFNNVWSVLDVVGGQSIAEVGPLFHAFYTDVAAEELSSHCDIVGATAKNLGTLVQSEFSWENISGSDLDNMLPSQCAVRVSLTGPGGTHGGPFLAGFSINAVNDQGLLDPGHADALVAATVTLAEDLVTAGWALRIDRPSIASTVVASTVRVGERIDVIRKRANELSESYTVASLV